MIFGRRRSDKVNQERSDQARGPGRGSVTPPSGSATPPSGSVTPPSGSVTPPSGSATGEHSLRLRQTAGRLSDELFDKLVIPMKMEQAVPSPVIAATLGALAGHACQVATIHGLTTGDPAYQGLSIYTLDGVNGESYLMGDAINRPVLDWQYSVWGLVGGITQHIGAPVPDPRELALHVVSTGGTDRFGIPRDLPAGAPTPRSTLRLWGVGEALAKDLPHPDYVPVVFGLAYQRLVQTDNLVDPSVDIAAMARIMMESTIAMSRLQASPADLGQLAPAR